MAADLIGSSGIQQTFVHDLESFFWVLLWIVLTQVETGWNDLRRSDFLETTFSPKIYGDSGSSSKLVSLTPNILHAHDFRIPGNTALTDFVHGLRSTVSSRYEFPPSREIPTYDPDRVDGEDQKAEEKYTSFKLMLYNQRSEYMKDHFKMLDAFSQILDDDKCWSKDDKANPQRFVPSRTAVCVSYPSSKRSRSVVEESGAFNTVSVSASKRRKG